jgi:hypothetical protein
MKTIDFHTHIFPEKIAEAALRQLSEHSGEYRPCTDGTLNGLFDSMEGAGIRLSVVSNIATKPSQAYPILRFSEEIISERIYPMISIHPENSLSEAEDILRKAEGLGIRGVKFHPMYQDFEIDSPEMSPLYRMISERGFFLMFHTGYDIAFPGNTNGDVERLKRLAEAMPELTIVATHLGGWRQWDRIHILKGFDNIYTEISMTLSEIDDGTFVTLLSNFREDNILFGTDSPWTDQSEMVRRVMGLPIPEDFREKILFRNAERFLQRFRYPSNTRETGGDGE